ncbi:MAG: precorrin-3B C(17)-methyltransferase [Clostridia bacterium]
MIYIVGLGPGEQSQMSGKALDAIKKSQVVAGYTVYIDLIKDQLDGKEVLSTPMMKEVERCRLAVLEAAKGKTVAMVSSGDAGIYGMASLMIEICEELKVNTEIEVIAGITAASSAAAVLGAPLTHDFAVISLSNLLTPWEKIEKRLDLASQAEFIIVLYNPSSKKRKDFLRNACDIVMKNTSGDTMCGYVRNIGRNEQSSKILTLQELRDEQVDMFTTVIIGNSTTKVSCGKLVTPRGYRLDD